MQAVLKNPSIVVRRQVLNLSQGKLDEEIPVQLLLADTSRGIKVVAKQFFSVVNNGKQ